MATQKPEIGPIEGNPPADLQIEVIDGDDLAETPREAACLDGEIGGGRGHRR